MIKIRTLRVLLTLCVAAYLFAAAGESPAGKDVPQQITKPGSSATLPLSRGTVAITIPANAAPMKEFLIKFVFKGSEPVSALSFRTNMKMNMGKFGGIPEKTGANVYELPLTLPRCMSGDTVWRGDFDIRYESGKTEKIDFLYDLK